MLLEPAECFMPALDIGVHQLGVIARTDGLLQVGTHGLGTVIEARSLCLIGAIDPHGTTGNRRGATEGLGFFDQQNLEPIAGSRGGCGKTGGTAA